MGFVKLSVSDHCSSPPSSVSIHLYQDFPMSYRKCLQNIDILREEIEAFVDLPTQREFQTWVRDRYAEEMVERCTRHIKGGWPIDGCSLIYLHWLCRYPPEVYYDHHHGLPQADFHAVVTRVMHLSDGWADTYLTPTSPDERASQVLNLPPELSEFSSCTLFADGVEYERTRRGLHGQADAKYWYGVKTRGPAWRVVVPLISTSPN